MAQYIIFSLLLIVYFELLGQGIFSYLNKKPLPFSFFIGFASFLGVAYLLTSILTTLNVSFYTFLAVVIILFICSVVLIIKEIKNIRINFKWYELLLIILMTYISFSFNLKTTFGDPYSFDAVYYANCVVGSISNANGINSFSASLGIDSSALSVTSQYSFQTYYYLCSVITYLISLILEILHRNHFYLTIYTSVFQILFTASLMSLIVNVCSKYLKKAIPLHLFVCVFFTMYISKLYYNNVFGFFGNSFRVVAMSYVTLLTIDLFSNKDLANKTLITLMLLAGCAFSSSFLFILVFYLFGLAFVYNDRDLFKWYGLTLFLPLINLLTFLLNNLYLSIIISLVLSLLLFIFNDFWYKLFNYKYSKAIILSLTTLIMFILSYRITHNIFDFTSFTNNISENYDMTINYFGNFGHNFKIKAIYLLSFVFLLISYKNKYSTLCLVLILCFLNPFCCSFINKINVVYYRTYDIIFNPFTLIYYFGITHEYLSNKKIVSSLTLVLEMCLLLFYSLSVSYEYPDWFHESFVPAQERYDRVNKFSKSEVDIVNELNLRIDKDSYVYTPNIFTFSMINKGSYYASRENMYSDNWNEYDFILRDTLYPYDKPELWGFNGRIYDNFIDTIKESHCNYLVIKNTDMYHDLENDTWYEMSLYLDQFFEYPDYSNEMFSIYNVDRIR